MGQAKEKKATEMTVGAEGTKWLMGHVNLNFGPMFSSEKDARRFSAGLASELIRDPRIGKLLADNPMARRSALVTLLTCILDGQILGVHTMLMPRGDKLSKEDKLEGSLALLEYYGYRPQRPVLVYEGDKFSQSRKIVDGRHCATLEHTPCGIDDPEKITGCYLILDRKDGGPTDWEYTPRVVFDKLRTRALASVAQDKRKWLPWQSSFGEMCQKTCAKRATRYINKVPMMMIDEASVAEKVNSIVSDAALSEKERTELMNQYNSGGYVEEAEVAVDTASGVVVDADALPLEEEQPTEPKKRGRPKKEPEPAKEVGPTLIKDTEPEPEKSDDPTAEVLSDDPGNGKTSLQ